MAKIMSTTYNLLPPLACCRIWPSHSCPKNSRSCFRIFSFRICRICRLCGICGLFRMIWKVYNPYWTILHKSLGFKQIFKWKTWLTSQLMIHSCKFETCNLSKDSGSSQLRSKVDDKMIKIFILISMNVAIMAMGIIIIFLPKVRFVCTGAIAVVWITFWEIRKRFTDRTQNLIFMMNGILR